MTSGRWSTSKVLVKVLAKHWKRTGEALVKCSQSTSNAPDMHLCSTLKAPGMRVITSTDF